MSISDCLACIIFSIIFACLSQFATEKKHDDNNNEIANQRGILTDTICLLILMVNVLAMFFYYKYIDNTINQFFAIGVVLSIVALSLFDAIHAGMEKNRARNFWLICLLISIIATIVVFLIG